MMSEAGVYSQGTTISILLYPCDDLRLHLPGGYPPVNKVNCLILLLSIILPQSGFSHVAIHLFNYCKHRLEWPIAIFNRLFKQI